MEKWEWEGEVRVIGEEKSVNIMNGIYNRGWINDVR